MEAFLAQLSPRLWENVAEALDADHLRISGVNGNIVLLVVLVCLLFSNVVAWRLHEENFSRWHKLKLE